MVALVLVLLLRLILRNLGWLRRRERAPDSLVVEVHAAEDEPIAGDDDLPDLPEDELLAHARRALEAGQLDEAVIYARGAALRRCARHGWLRLHRARTDREYLRKLRGQPDTQANVRTVLDAVEDHRWAGRQLTEDGARGAVEAAARVLSLALAALLCVGLLLPGEAVAGPRRYAPMATRRSTSWWKSRAFGARASGWTTSTSSTPTSSCSISTRWIPRPRPGPTFGTSSRRAAAWCWPGIRGRPSKTCSAT